MATLTPSPAVISLSIVPALRVEALLHGLYPHDPIRIDSAANALIVVANPDDLTAMRAIATGVDVRSPSASSVDAIQLHSSNASDLVSKLKPVFPRALLLAGPNDTIIVSADALESSQIRSVVTELDTPAPTPSPKVVAPATVVRVTQEDPKIVAHAAARAVPTVGIAVSGSNLLLRGTPDDVTQAKTIIAQLDQPPATMRYTQIYRLAAIDASSVASLLSRSFPDADVEVDKDLNALSVLATMRIQHRVADAVAQLDVAPGPQQGAAGTAYSGIGSGSEVISLHAAVPGVNGAASTSAAEMAQTVTQALGPSAGDLHITVYPNSTKLVLTGSPRSIEMAKDLIAKLDIAEPLVELDTEVLEVDDSVQKQLGFKFPTPVLSTTYSELQPLTNAVGGTSQLLGFAPLTRTPLTLEGELDFLISTNKARILEDPRITTFSGRTASLRAGETVNILTTAGGGSGTVATTQVQSFQTGVTLDITPVVNTDDYVTVTLHPSVNSEAGVSAAGVPNIQTRDTTTTIGLHDGETIVVGGLIEDMDSRSVDKVPLLGDLPLIGRLFQDVGVNHARNELIVTVTPHILKPGSPQRSFGPPLPAIPTPEALPTLEPTATLPPARSRAVAAATPQPESRASTRLAAPSMTATPAPTATPQAPGPFPTAFSQTNMFTYGSAPTNNYADSTQPPQIFFVQVQPTVVRDGQPITISVVTTTNVSTLSFGPTSVTSLVSLGMIGPGKWQSTFNFSAASLPSTSGNVDELLTAATSLGGTASLRIPLSLSPK